MAVALKKEDLDGPVAKKLIDAGINVILDNDTLDPSKTRNLLVIDPMPLNKKKGEDPNKTRNNINTNIISLVDSDDIILRPTIWNMDVECDEETATIDVSDAKFDEIKQEDYDLVVSAGASADHIEYDKFENLDKLRKVFRWASENTGGLLTICWSSMVAFNEFHNIPKYVDKNDEGKLVKIIGHFENAVANDNSPYTEALRKTKTLPLGCTGHIKDKDIYALQKEGKVSVLSTNPEKDDVASNSTIAVVLEKNKHRHVAYWGPHPDYKLSYVMGEVTRDLDPETAQPNVIIEKVIGRDRFGPEHDWKKGASEFFRIFLQASYDRKRTMNDNERINTLEQETALKPIEAAVG